MKKLMKLILALAVPVSLCLTACKKDHADVNPKTPNHGDSTVFYTSVENDINSVDEAIDDAQSVNPNERKGDRCYTVTFESDTSSPVPGYELNYRKFSMTFTGTCDSLNRTGQIIVYKSGSWLTGNYKDSAVFSGYTTDGRSLSGYKTRSISTSSDLKNLVFTYANNITITTASGQTITHKSGGKKVFVNYLLPGLTSIEISGQGLYTHANGNQVSFTITKTIILKGSCQRKFRFPVQGTVIYTNTASNYTSTVDFGDGTCDKLASISVNNGAAVTFKLK